MIDFSKVVIFELDPIINTKIKSFEIIHFTVILLQIWSSWVKETADSIGTGFFGEFVRIDTISWGSS